MSLSNTRRDTIIHIFTSRQRRLFLLALLPWMLPLQMRAQTSLAGKVTDEEGEPVVSAAVSLAEIPSGAVRRIGTDASGLFLFRNLPAGRYLLTVSAVGYRNSVDTIDLHRGESRRLDITLQESAIEQHEMVVSATRTVRDIASIPFRVEIIPAEDLDESITDGLGSARLVLAELPGVLTQVTSSALGASTVRLHGIDGRYTEILVDGIPAFGGLNMNFSLVQLPPLNLRQLEIIKGSSAGLHSDAIGGIVNYITKVPAPGAPKLTAVVNGTSLGGVDLAGFYARQFDDVGIAFHTTFSSSPRRDIDGDGLADVPLQRRINLNPKAIIALSPRMRLTMAANLLNEDRLGGEMSAPEDFSGGSPTVYATALSTRRVDGSGAYVWTPDEHTSISANLTAARTQRNSYIQTNSFDGVEDILYGDASWSGSLGWSNLLVGISGLSQKFRESSFDSLAGARRDLAFSDISGFLQIEVPFSDLLTGMSSLRWDGHNRYGGVLTPRFSLMARPSDALTFRASIGTGWHAPTVFDEKAEQVDYHGVPPISGVSREAAESYSFDVHHRAILGDLAITSDINLFSTTVHHRVDLVPASASEPAGGWAWQDIGDLRSRGFEILVNSRLDRWSIAFGYTFADVTEGSNGAEARKLFTPSHFLNGTFGWEYPLHTRIAGDFLYESPQQLPPNPYRGSSPAFATFGISIEQWLTTRVSLFVNAENAFDTRQTHTMPLALGTPGKPDFDTDFVWGPVEGRVVNLGAKISL